MGGPTLSDLATIDARSGVDVDTVRGVLLRWARSEEGIVKMDRPLREIADGRHFHIAAPDRGTGTLEVNVRRDPVEGRTEVEVICRDHWRGTWAGGAIGSLVEALASAVGG